MPAHDFSPAAAMDTHGFDHADAQLLKGAVFREKSTGRIFTVESASEKTVLLIQDGLLFSTKRDGFEQTMRPSTAQYRVAATVWRT
jgi:hypothetical protein